MPRTVVIGYGNTLRGDDALGPQAIECLRPLLASHAELLACHQLSPELAATLAEYDAAVFVDAAAEGVPGAVQVRRVQAAGNAASLTHHVDPASLLALARELYGHAPRAMLVTGVGAEFALSAECTLSTAATRALEAVCRSVTELVEDFPANW